MNFCEAIEYVAKIKSNKDLMISFNETEIIFSTFPVSREIFVIKENNTNIKNKILYQGLNKLIKLSKMIKLNDFDILIENNNLIIKNYKSCFIFTVEDDYLESTNNISLENYTLCGILDNLQINEMIDNYKKMKIDCFRTAFHNYFVINKKMYITNSFLLLIKNTDLKDCVINLEKLQNFKNESKCEIYTNGIDFIYKNEMNITKFNDADNIKFKDVITNVTKQKKVIKFNLKIDLKNKFKDTDLFNFDFKNKILTISNDITENKLIYNLDCIELDYSAQFKYQYLKLLINKNEFNIKIEIVEKKENYDLIYINENILMPTLINYINNIDYTPENLIELQNKINAFESNNQTPVITKEVVKTTKTKKPKTMNLKKEIKTKPIKSKYYELVTEVIEPEIIEAEIIEIENTIYESKEIVKYIAPKIDLKVEKIEIEPVTQIKKRSVSKQLKPVKKEVKNELSETIITPNFDIIDFLYIACFNDLENLEFYNTDYKNNRLYLDNCELSFNQIKDKIEVTELDVNCKLHFYNIKDKKELLNLVRSKIKAAA